MGRLGANLHLLLRDHRLALPNDQELLDELMTVRLRESAPGVYRLDHDSGQHDDRAVSLGLAGLALTERTDSDLGSFTVPRGIMTRAGGRGGAPGRPGTLNPTCAARAIRGRVASAYVAQRAQTPAQRSAGVGLNVPGRVNDPQRTGLGP